MQNLEFINKILEAMQYKIQELEIDKEEIKITFLDGIDPEEQKLITNFIEGLNLSSQIDMPISILYRNKILDIYKTKKSIRYFSFAGKLDKLWSLVLEEITNLKRKRRGVWIDEYRWIQL